MFNLKSKYNPAGDQPKAIEDLAAGINNQNRDQTLLGVTGSGKTFTMANVIAETGKPALVIAHNKTLAAQLAQEYREFFPENAVHYFVSYYDYYQPEAYIPVTDTYIEKEAQINEEIDRLRHAATQALLTREDVIIVASVSCIYSLGSPAEYEKVHLRIEAGKEENRFDLVRKLVDIYFERTGGDLEPGKFRVIGNMVEIMPINEKVIYRINLEEGRIGRIDKIDAISRGIIEKPKTFFLFPAKHFVTPENEKERAMQEIRHELRQQLKELKEKGKLLEAQRLERRTNHDLAMIKEIGYCNGIENYSRHFDGRKPGEAPHSLLSYFPHKPGGAPDFLTIIDESHVTLPQIAGMYAGDRARKKTLIEHGFRLPSAVDNRPLTFDEFREKTGQMIFTSATPAKFEMEKSAQVVEQIIRPTGLADPEVVIKPVVEKGSHPGQVEHFIQEAQRVIGKGGRVLATTLTKKMAEDLAEFLEERGMKSKYLHSEIKTIDRIDIITEFRKGGFDCLVGVNLLREGLDIPEVSLIGIFDADKEGFLRSETSLIQTMGRAARNVDGRVILYADKITGSLKRAVNETRRRRKIQLDFNKKHNITPKTIEKNIYDITDQIKSEREKTAESVLELELKNKKPKQLIKEKQAKMDEAVKVMDFETAAVLRDEIRMLENNK
ncbi:MAG: excinuclease ABC subunit UvrB [Candidatus Moranbacteria bacterium]|nr:excinuclease ABC subunit UvrB [Candidatus Moranbacteria bacterium]